MKKQTIEQRKELAKKYIDENIWKQFFKQKIYELGVIPLVVLSIWKIPLWLGYLIITIFKIDIENNPFYCSSDIYGNCIGAMPSINIWSMGFILLLLIILFISFNWNYAKNKLLKEAVDKYNLDYFEVYGL